jgi:hypothetical protein
MNKAVLIKRVFVGFIVILLVVLAAYLIQKVLTPSEGEKQFKELTDNNPYNSAGVIQGTLTTPSNDIPVEDILICVEDTVTQARYCTTEFTDSKYTLEIPQGTYNVYSLHAVEGTKAYYSEYVLCGSKDTCPSHTPLNVVVKPGETVTGIDPTDWKAD